MLKKRLFLVFQNMPSLLKLKIILNTEKRFQKAIYTAVYRHLRVSNFRLGNYNTRQCGGILD